MRFGECFGGQTIRGMPFAFGQPDASDVLLLDGDGVSVELGDVRATYLVFVHVAEDRVTTYRDGLADDEVTGWDLGELVSEYELEYLDGAIARVPILRRFAIQQARYAWGSAPFACVPAADDEVFPASEEMQLLGRIAVEPGQMASGTEGGLSLRERVAWAYGARHQTRTASAHERGLDPVTAGRLWVYALPNPQPEQPLRRVTCRPREARSAVYAMTLTELIEHPLRRDMRRKLRLRLPDGVSLNAAGEVDEIGIDLGTVISARSALEYDTARWAGDESVVEPSRSSREVVVEYAAHPDARLYVGERVYELGDTRPRTSRLSQPPIDRSGCGSSTASCDPASPSVFTCTARRANTCRRAGTTAGSTSSAGVRTVAAEFANVENQYAYVDGECIVDLPLGTIFVEVTRGYEIAPLRTSFEVGPETDELVFELEQVLRWRERGWVTADTHVHFLSPQTALLEGRAEGVNVVNLLASQWGEMFSNVGDFDGKTTVGADDLGGGGEFVVRVGSENRMQVLGHISLLGYSGELIQPLCSGGPDESAFGDPLEVTMAEWAQRCIDQGGLVVMPHAPMPQLERAADIVLGLVHAIELQTANPLQPGFEPGVRAAQPLRDRRLVSLSEPRLSRAARRRLGQDERGGAARWHSHVRSARRSRADLRELDGRDSRGQHVRHRRPARVDAGRGRRARRPAAAARRRAGPCRSSGRSSRVRMPIDRVEVVVGGLVGEETDVGGELSARGRATVRVSRSTLDRAAGARQLPRQRRRHRRPHQRRPGARRGLRAVLRARLDGGPRSDPGRDRVRRHDRHRVPTHAASARCAPRSRRHTTACTSACTLPASTIVTRSTTRPSRTSTSA